MTISEVSTPPEHSKARENHLPGLSVLLANSAGGDYGFPTYFT